MLTDELKAASELEPSSLMEGTSSKEEFIRQALNCVLNRGETPTCAARKWGVSRTTLLYRVLYEKKRRKAVDTIDSDGVKQKLFQSKFTSKQLLSAQQEADLTQYLKQCYEMQSQQHHLQASSPPNNKNSRCRLPLLSEEMARNFTHNFVHMHNLRYPVAWDAKQQASADWFNGYVDRNPEVIEYVAPVVKMRKQRKADHLEKDDALVIGNQHLRTNRDSLKSADHIAIQNNISREDTLSSTVIKNEPIDDDMDEAQFSSTIEMEESFHNPFNPLIPEIIYESAMESEMESQQARSIAESVKRRNARKPRVSITANDFDAALRIKAKPQKLKRNILNGGNKIKMEKIQKEQQLHFSAMNSLNNINATEPLVELKGSVERMHTDMNYLLQSMLMEMNETNRLLRRIIASNKRPK